MINKNNKTPKIAYKYFNFPNKLTAVEQLFYYFREFGIIPSTIEAGKFEKLYRNIVVDYLSGCLDTDRFASISSVLAYRMVNPNKITPGLYEVMCHAAEMDSGNSEEVNVIKKLLEIYVKNPQKLSKLYKEDRIEKFFTE